MTTTVYRERANRYRAEISALLLACLIAILAFGVFDYSGSGTVDGDLWFFLPLLLVFWLSVRSGGGQKGPTTLKLEDQGLTYAYHMTIRHWPWTELSAAEIPTDGGEAEYCIRVRPDRRIDWKTRLMMPGVPLNGSELRIRPIFDAPLTEICAKLNDYRERALGGGDAPGGPDATSQT